MKCWNCCSAAYTIILEQALHNVTISYDKTSIFGMLAILEAFKKFPVIYNNIPNKKLNMQNYL